jgi:L-alanine-DL-glutamate epimerase-like enolase superfamily enzyme
MKISSVKPFVHPDFPNLVYVEVTTDEGIVGLGESYYFGSTVAHFINEFAGPAILGKDPLDRESISKTLTTYVGYNSSGVETRARSAIDIALWDIAGKIANKPIYRLIGGDSPRPLRIYNTCAGKEYMRKSNQGSKSWGLDNESNTYEDLRAFMSDAGSLAKELLSEGVTAMKIWPFDLFSEKNWGSEISAADLKSGLAPIEKIRAAVGSRMDIMVELHALWSPKAAKEIMTALKEYEIYWVEDPIYPDNLDELESLRGDGMPPIAHGETIASRKRVETLVKRNLIDVLTLDLSWCGGLTEGLHFAELARANDVKIAPHDCTGPVGLTIGAHLSTADENALIQETVRAAYRTWYPHLVDGLPEINGGTLALSESAGLGLRLREDFRKDLQTLRLAVNS